MIVRIQGFDVLVDDDLAVEIVSGGWKIESHIEPTGRVYRYVVKCGRKNGKDILRRLHREIAGAPDGMFVDHKNGNTLDNRKSNLRICTPAQNSRNKVASATSEAPYKGIKKRNQKWEARIWVDGRAMYLGVHETPEKAAAVYAEAARKYFGEFDVHDRQS